MILKKKFIIALILIVGILSASLLVYQLLLPGNDNQNERPVIKGGTITQNETWSDAIFVNESILAPKGITLTILPGTHIYFKPCRDYKSLQYIGFAVVEGTIIANGTSTKQIWFTSGAEKPINGDWGGIEMYRTNTFFFNYVIVEYANMGIAQFDSKVNISHSIVRWMNSEITSKFQHSY